MNDTIKIIDAIIAATKLIQAGQRALQMIADALAAGRDAVDAEAWARIISDNDAARDRLATLIDERLSKP